MTAKVMKFIKQNKIILTILLIGIMFRLVISANGNFIFNMDNARDMVDVREMVVLHKPRLIGQTTSIDGVFYGPAWYYFLAMPFILTGGNPYGAILLEILLWAVGGYFLLFLMKKFYGLIAMLVVGSIWVASNFVLLGSQYAFNPNPILFLSPVFIFTLWKYLETKEIKYSVISFLLAGLFLHFEVTTGIFMLPIILLAIFLSKKWSFFKDKSLYFGLLAFFITLSPQIFFELRHNFFMTHSLLSYHSGSHGDVATNPDLRFKTLWNSYYDTLMPTLMNFELLEKFLLIAFGGMLILKFWKKERFDLVTGISLLMVLVPFFGLQPLKVDVMRWYLNGMLVGSLFLIGWVIKEIGEIRGIGGISKIIIMIMVGGFALNNMKDYLIAAGQYNPGNSIFKNEVTAIDYTYKQAQGKNFKVYVYMPSVLDWPYQYLYWWYGLKKYGYLPEDYAYAPNKPEYVNQKQKLDTGAHPEDGGLIFLIKEPDRPDLQDLWGNNFKGLELVNHTMVGVITIETRKPTTIPNESRLEDGI